jgi:cytochrome b561
MALRNDERSWSTPIKTLHWLIALLVIALGALGLYMKGLPNSPAKIQFYALHKSLGLTVLALVALRILVRVSDRRPPHPPTLPAWQRVAAESVHVLLYLALIAMPLSGWLFNSAANFPLKWFGVLSLPALSGPDPELKALARAAHFWLFWCIVALFVVHVGAALRHHFVDRDDVLRRMLPFGRARARAITRESPPLAVPTTPAASPEEPSQ